jgi:hypothetical protein
MLSKWFNIELLRCRGKTFVWDILVHMPICSLVLHGKKPKLFPNFKTVSQVSLFDGNWFKVFLLIMGSSSLFYYYLNVKMVQK